MEEKIQLRHPAGKHAVRMDSDKYQLFRNAILKSLPEGKAVTHGELLKFVLHYLKKNKISFNGSVEWHMETVKLDLEANKLITRVKESGRQYFKLSNHH